MEFLSLVWPFTMGGHSRRFLEEAEPRGNLVLLHPIYYTHRSYVRAKRAFIENTLITRSLSYLFYSTITLR